MYILMLPISAACYGSTVVYPDTLDAQWNLELGCFFENLKIRPILYFLFVETPRKFITAFTWCFHKRKVSYVLSPCKPTENLRPILFPHKDFEKKFPVYCK